MVLLDAAGLFYDAVVGPHNRLPEEPLPLPVGEGVVVEGLQLAAEVVHQVRLAVEGQVLIALGLQAADEVPLQFRLALVGPGLAALRGVLGHHGALRGGGDDVVLTHPNHLLFCNKPKK